MFELTPYAKKAIQGKTTFPGDFKGFKCDLVKATPADLEKIYERCGEKSAYVQKVEKSPPAPAAAKSTTQKAKPKKEVE